MSFKPLSPIMFTLLAKALYRAFYPTSAIPSGLPLLPLNDFYNIFLTPVIAKELKWDAEGKPKSPCNTVADFVQELQAPCCFPLIIKGVTEEHIVFAQYFIGDGDKLPFLYIFDSKSTPKSSSTASALGFSEQDLVIEYQPGNSQSNLDASTCGYHTLAKILDELADATGIKLTKNAFTLLIDALTYAADATTSGIERADAMSIRIAEAIRTQITDEKSVDPQASEVTQAFLVDFNKSPTVKAMESASLVKRESTSVRQRVLDFIGFPKSGVAQRVFYFLSLAFVFRPLITTIKLATEFLPMQVDEALGGLEESLKAFIPLANKSTKNQRLIDTVVAIKASARSVGLAVVYFLRGVFSTVGFVGGLLTSPIETATRLWEGKSTIKNPIVRKVSAVLSLLVSIGLWLAILFFALPAALPALAVAIPALAPVVGSLLSAFSTPLLALAAGSAATLVATILRLGSIIAKKIDELGDGENRFKRALKYDLEAGFSVPGSESLSQEPEAQPKPEPNRAAYAAILVDPESKVLADPKSPDGPPRRGAENQATPDQQTPSDPDSDAQSPLPVDEVWSHPS